MWPPRQQNEAAHFEFCRNVQTQICHRPGALPLRFRTNFSRDSNWSAVLFVRVCASAAAVPGAAGLLNGAAL